jgi:imidazolonepropionase-like amidohydrolase
MKLAFRTYDSAEVELGIEGHSWSEDGDGPLIDLRGYWALPGLADCHAHLGADSLAEVDRGGDIDAIQGRAFAQLQNGVFLVIDKGWRDEVVLRLLDKPPQARPQLEAAGRLITGPVGYFPGFGVEVEDYELPAAVANANTTGGWVKLVGDWPQKGKGPVVNFGEEALARACEIAHFAGARVAIHAMAPITPTLAVRAGVDSIEHGLYLTEDDIAQLGGRRGAWVPTIANTENVIAGFPSGSTAARVLGTGLERLHSLLPLAAEAGVAILAGTDLGLRHGQVAKEVQRLQERGLDAVDALLAAGPAAYSYCALRPFQPGSEADLLLFAEDPTADLTALSRPVAGLRAGAVVLDRIGAFASF